MAQGDRGTLGLVDCQTPDVTFGGISQWGFNPGMQRIVEASGGAVDPTFVGIMGLAPVLTFATKQLSAIASFGIGGAQITTMEAYVQKLTAYGTRAGVSSHTKIAIATGFCVPRSISAQQGSVAELALEAIALSTDGSTAAATVTTSATIPAGGTVGEAFTIGPVKINGTTIDCESIQVDFGLQLQIDASGGQVYPTYACIMDRRPTIRCTSKDFDTINTLYGAGLFATAQGASDSVVYFRKLAKNGTRLADDGSLHISLTIDDGLISIDEAALAQGDKATVPFTITPTYDGSNAIMVISATADIT